MATDAIRPLTAQGLYKAVVTNLDKTNAASFTVEHFNQFANSGQLDYYHERYKLYEENQQLTDDLRAMVSTFTYLPANTTNLGTTQTCTLPEDYFHAERVAPWFTPNRTFSSFKINEPVMRTAQRLTADMQGFAERPNHYHRPTYNNTGWRIMGNLLIIKSGQPHSGLVLTKVEFEYLRMPPQITLYESDVQDLTIDNSQTLLWPAAVTLEIVKRITALIMEQHGNQRLGTFTQVQSVIPNQSTSGGGQAAEPGQRAQQRAQSLSGQ